MMTPDEGQPSEPPSRSKRGGMASTLAPLSRSSRKDLGREQSGGQRHVLVYDAGDRDWLKTEFTTCSAQIRRAGSRRQFQPVFMMQATPEPIATPRGSVRAAGAQ